MQMQTQIQVHTSANRNTNSLQIHTSKNTNTNTYRTSAQMDNSLFTQTINDGVVHYYTRKGSLQKSVKCVETSFLVD